VILCSNANENDLFLKRIITGDEKWIVYINVERKRSWGKRYEPPLIAKSRFASEESDAVYLVGLEGHCVLRIPSTQLDDKFGQILFPITPTKGSNR